MDDADERTLDGLIKKEGLAKAVTQFIREHGRLPTQEFTVIEWWEIFGEVDYGGEHSKPGQPDTLIWNKMRELLQAALENGRVAELAVTHNEWVTVEVLAGEFGLEEIRQSALRRLVETSQTFEEWDVGVTDEDGLFAIPGVLEMVAEEPPESEVMRLALERLSQCDFTIEQWVEILTGWMGDEPFPPWTTAWNKLQEKVTTREGWQAILAMTQDPRLMACIEERLEKLDQVD